MKEKEKFLRLLARKCLILRDRY